MGVNVYITFFLQGINNNRMSANSDHSIYASEVRQFLEMENVINQWISISIRLKWTTKFIENYMS